MTPEDLSQADPDLLAQLVPQLLSGAMLVPDLPRLQQIASTVSSDGWGALGPQLAMLGEAHAVYPAHQGLRHISRAWMGDMIQSPVVEGLEHLTGVCDGPTVLVTNHISYVDANAKDAILAAAAGPELANRIAFLAGPKVYEHAFLRVAVGALTSLPVPQPRGLGHNQARLPPRELAARALTTVQASAAHLESGGLLAFYPEGSRSRTGRMGTFFKGTWRYLKAAKYLVPAALIGTDELMPVGLDRLRPAPVRLRIAPAIDLQTVRARDALGLAFDAIAALLPPEMQPEAGTRPLQ